MTIYKPKRCESTECEATFTPTHHSQRFCNPQCREDNKLAMLARRRREDPEYRAKINKSRRESAARTRADPVRHASMLATNRRRYHRLKIENPEKIKARQQQSLAAVKARCESDPEYKEAQNKRVRDWARNRRQTDDEFRLATNQKRTDLYHSNPEYRAAVLEYEAARGKYPVPKGWGGKKGVWERQGRRCAISEILGIRSPVDGERAPSWKRVHSDHIVSIARLVRAEIDTTDPEIVGWENHNLWLVDADLNGSKNDAIVYEWAEKQGALPWSIALFRALHFETARGIIQKQQEIYPQWKLTEERREILGIAT